MSKEQTTANYEHIRKRYIPKNSMTVRSKRCNAVVYVVNGAKPHAVGFYGKARNPSFNFLFRSEERMRQYITEWFESMEKSEAFKAEQRAKRTGFQHTLKVGDLLYTNWGYDQTNVEFFQVTKLVGSKMVEVREISRQSESTGDMTGVCVPKANAFIGEPKRCKPRTGNACRIDDVRTAYYYEQKEIAPGVKVGRALSWSSYA